jgi:hypothetical protein
VRLAARGARDLDHGEEPVSDPNEATRLRAQTRRIYTESLAIAALTTGLALLVSVWAAG